MTEESKVERFAGSQLGMAVTGAGIALVPPTMAALGLTGDPFAMSLFQLIPNLAAGALSERTTNRIKAAIKELNREIGALRVDFEELTDDQVQFTADAVAVMFSTVSQTKLDYLRAAVISSLADPTYVANKSAPLARLVRDIAPDELLVLRELYHYPDGVQVVEKPATQGTPGVYRAYAYDAKIVEITGLIRLGLLTSYSTHWDSVMYKWSPLVPKLLALTLPKR